MSLLNSSSNTIWQFNGFYKTKIQPQYQVVLQESYTPLVETTINGAKVFLKREDQSAVGSHKFRPLSYQTAYLLQQGLHEATLSSSGNAAIAMSKISALYPIKSYIFIAPNTSQGKKSNISTQNTVIFESKLAPRLSNYLAKKTDISQLRPSKDDNAIEGYKSLGFEIFEQNPNVDAIFLCVTSGASLLGVYEAYATTTKMPALHCVFGQGKVAPHRLTKLKEVVKNSGGKIWELDEKELEEAKKLLSVNGIETSIEGVKAFLASQKARDEFNYQSPVVVFSGKKWQINEQSNQSAQFIKVENMQDLDEVINKINSAK